MLELMIKMSLWLVVALVLGFTIGWLLSKYLIEKKYIKRVDKLSSNLSTSEDAVKKLKEINLTREDELKSMMSKNKKNRSELEIQRQNIWKMKKELTASEQSLKENLNAKEYNQSLLHKSIELERLLEQNEQEISGLEGVLIKAEMMLEESNKKIALLENKHKKDNLKEEFEELVMTKDQFSYIEAQLSEYQKEISKLQDINRKLQEKCDTKEENSEVDDSPIVKLFEDTYKKIIKS